MKTGYVAAGAMPWKLMKKAETVIQDGKIIPYHIQLIPTNHCNSNCPWCSCKGVDRTLELSIDEIVPILKYFKNLGSEAITITGGGEPTIHPNIEDIIKCCANLDIEIGMVTNGIRLGDIKTTKSFGEVFNKNLTWCRVSINNTESPEYPFKRLVRIFDLLNRVDLGLSFTVTNRVSIELAKKLAIMVNAYKRVTHIRFVQDILNANDKACHDAMTRVQNICSEYTDKGIYQFRDKPTWGSEKCLISKLKPVINCDGYIYPCCGAQYATKEKSVMPKSMRMCKWSSFHNVKAFKGQVCEVCYYDDYNRCLDHLVSSIEHERFL